MTPSGPKSLFAGRAAFGGLSSWRQVALGYLLVALPLVVMLTLIIYPASLSVFDTLTDQTPAGGLRFSLDDYRAFFDTPLAVTNLIFSLRITVITVIVLMLIGLPISLFLRFTQGRLSDIIQMLSMFPLFVPGIIAAYALIRFLGKPRLAGPISASALRLRGFCIALSSACRYRGGSGLGRYFSDCSDSDRRAVTNTGPFTGDGAGCRSQPPADILAHRNPAHAAVSPDRPDPELPGRILGPLLSLIFWGRHPRK